MPRIRHYTWWQWVGYWWHRAVLSMDDSLASYVVHYLSGKHTWPLTRSEVDGLRYTFGDEIDYIEWVRDWKGDLITDAY